jgi:hypothetical protein
MEDLLESDRAPDPLSRLLAAWSRVNAEPGLCRNPDLSQWLRRAADGGVGAPAPFRTPGGGAALAPPLLLAHNPDHRRTKRPTSTAAPGAEAAPLPVRRDFNPQGFHFGKAALAEVVCLVRLPEAGAGAGADAGAKGGDAVTWLSPLGLAAAEVEAEAAAKAAAVPAAAAAAVPAAAAPACGDGLLSALPPAAGAEHALVITATPLVRGHTLFVPRAAAGLPQVATAPLLALGLRLARLFGGAEGAGAGFSCGFNSLAAFSSVNHFHLHALLPGEIWPGATALPVEAAPLGRALWRREAAAGHGGAAALALRCDVLEWHVRGLAFEIEHSAGAGIGAASNGDE